MNTIEFQKLCLHLNYHRIKRTLWCYLNYHRKSESSN